MTDQTRAMVQGWVADHRGDTESVALYMARTLRLGGLRDCRTLVREAMVGVRHDAPVHGSMA